MSRGRLIGLALALVGVLAIVASSYLTLSGGRPAPADRAAVIGDAGNAPAASGMLDTAGYIDFWRRRVERNPADYISYTEIAVGFLRRARETGDVDSYSRAEEAVRRALELNPKYETAINYMGSILYAKHDFAGALANAERVMSLNPGAAQALALSGDANLELGNYSDAQSAYDKLRSIAQTGPVLSRLARLTELNGRPQDAIELMRQAAAEADDSESPPETRAWYRFQLGNLYFNTGDIEAAKSQYQLSLDSFPNYVHALAGLGRVSAARGDFDEAASLYDQVTQRFPITEYVVALGDVYRAAGRPDEAQRQYDLVSAIDGLYKANGINTDLQMALYFADHDLRLDDALSQARAEYQRRQSVQAADVLAWALYKTGQYDEALTYSQEALRLGTRDALMRYHAGMIQYRLGNYDEARKYLGEALDINPRFSVLYADQAAKSLDELNTLTRN